MEARGVSGGFPRGLTVTCLIAGETMGRYGMHLISGGQEPQCMLSDYFIYSSGRSDCMGICQPIYGAHLGIPTGTSFERGAASTPSSFSNHFYQTR